MQTLNLIKYYKFTNDEKEKLKKVLYYFAFCIEKEHREFY